MGRIDGDGPDVSETDQQRWPIDPIDRLSEVMFGLLMALTFTGTMSVTLGDGGTVRGILLAAIGCNIAWGIVDAIVYVLTTTTERARRLAQVEEIRTAPGQHGHDLLRALLPEAAGQALGEAEVKAIVTWLRQHPSQGTAAVLQRSDLKAAFAVFLMVTGATWPPILPFMLFDHVPLAMRVSNAVAVCMLFVIGLFLDREMKNGGHVMRWVIPVIGTAMVVVTIALGG